jgi:hypothetical protein
LLQRNKLKPKESETARVPMIPEADFPMLSKKTLNRNPIKGANNKSKAKFVFIVLNY